MNEFFLDFIAQLDNDLITIKTSTPDILACYQKSTDAAIRSYEGLKNYLKDNPFKSKEEEIHFFKYIVPVVISKVHFYSLMYKHECKKYATTSCKERKLLCKKMLKNIKSYNTEHQYIINQVDTI